MRNGLDDPHIKEAVYKMNSLVSQGHDIFPMIQKAMQNSCIMDEKAVELFKILPYVNLSALTPEQTQYLINIADHGIGANRVMHENKKPNLDLFLASITLLDKLGSDGKQKALEWKPQAIKWLRQGWNNTGFSAGSAKFYRDEIKEFYSIK